MKDAEINDIMDRLQDLIKKDTIENSKIEKEKRIGVLSQIQKEVMELYKAKNG